MDDRLRRGRDLLAALVPEQRDPRQTAAVRADDELVEALRAGLTPPIDDPLVRLLAAWRDTHRTSG